MTDRTGQTLQNGRYTLQAPLGAGGMATVYRAWDGLLAVERAIKVLSDEAVARDAIRARFLDEARTMARLRHPNLVTVHDLGADGACVFMVMELLGGGSVSDCIVRRGRIAPARACTLVAQALDALQVAHDAGVVHRDIKPQNLLLDGDGVVKLTDFGIARSESSAAGHTRTGVMLGTWAYMPPEQRDDPRRVGPAADIYAMACTLYAMVTAKRPVDLYVHAAREERIAHLPPPLAEVIRRATAYRPDARYPSAGAMAEALRAVVGTLEEGAELPAGPDGAPVAALPTIADDLGDGPPPEDLGPESLCGEDLGSVATSADPPAPLAPGPTLDPLSLSQATQPMAPPPPAAPDRTRLLMVALAAVAVLALIGSLAANWMGGSAPAPVEAAAEPVPPAPAPTEVGVPLREVGAASPGGIPGSGPNRVPTAGAELPPPGGGPPAPGGTAAAPAPGQDAARAE